MNIDFQPLAQYAVEVFFSVGLIAATWFLRVVCESLRITAYAPRVDKYIQEGMDLAKTIAKEKLAAKDVSVNISMSESAAIGVKYVMDTAPIALKRMGITEDKLYARIYGELQKVKATAAN